MGLEKKVWMGLILLDPTCILGANGANPVELTCVFLEKRQFDKVSILCNIQEYTSKTLKNFKMLYTVSQTT